MPLCYTLSWVVLKCPHTFIDIYIGNCSYSVPSFEWKLKWNEKKNQRTNDWISFIMKEKLIEAVLKRPPHTHTHSVNTRANAIYSLLISLWIKLSDEMRKKKRISFKQCDCVDVKKREKKNALLCWSHDKGNAQTKAQIHAEHRNTITLWKWTLNRVLYSDQLGIFNGDSNAPSFIVRETQVFVAFFLFVFLYSHWTNP